MEDLSLGGLAVHNKDEVKTEAPRKDPNKVGYGSEDEGGQALERKPLRKRKKGPGLG
jgi:hypothetical protein